MRCSISNLIPLIVLPLALACGDLGVVLTDGPPRAEDPTSNRTIAGLQALYLFDTGYGDVISDRSDAGLWSDMRIASQSSVLWIPGGGLEVLSPTTIVTTGPATKIGLACQASNALTIETWAATAVQEQSGPASVLTFSGGGNARNFTLGQDNGLADVRVRTTDTNENGWPATLSRSKAFDGQVRHLVYSWSGEDGLAELWIDGELEKTEPLAGDLSTWDTSFQFAVANEVNGARPWRGQLYLVAVYCRDLAAIEIRQNFRAGF